ncbi:MAG: Spy/CpxP family protein refolding chaperone [Magnetococcus sp. YQC-5]
MGGGWAEHPEALKSRLNAFKQHLGITQAQEAAWAAYTKTLIDQNDAKVKMHSDMNNIPDQDPVEIETRRIEAMESMLAQKKAVLQGYKALYAQLDERQKGIIGPAQTAPCNH